MNPRSLRFRMTLWYAGLLAGALLLFASAVYLGLQRHLNRQLERSLIEQAHTIGEELLVNVRARGDQFAVTEINESYAPEINGRFIRVTRPDGSVLYHSNSPRDGSFEAAAIPPASADDAAGFTPRLINVAGRQVVLQGYHYTAPNGERFLIETGVAYRAVADELHSIRLAFVLGIPVFLLVAVAGGLVLVRNSLQPIREIIEQAERISSANISQRLPVVATGDEVERLSLSLNRMIERLENAIEHISRFSADVSHELRTPLTILRGELESMLDKRPRDAETLETVGNALEEIERLTRIVDQLLILSRLDAGQAGIEKSPIDLGKLAVATAEQMSLLADEKEISMHYAIEKEIWVAGDSLRLKQILVNLLDNAIKYTPERGAIELAVRREAGAAVLAVSDTGTGIAAHELPHVFERFYRADKARTRSTGGAGLGLSIVKAIAVAHDARVSVESTEGQGTSVRVELPGITPQHGQQAMSAEGAPTPMARALS